MYKFVYTIEHFLLQYTVYVAMHLYCDQVQDVNMYMSSKLSSNERQLRLHSHNNII